MARRWTRSSKEREELLQKARGNQTILWVSKQTVVLRLRAGVRRLLGPRGEWQL